MQIAECRLHYAVFSYSHWLLVNRHSPVVARYGFVYSAVWVGMWRLVHQWSFFAVWLCCLLTVGRWRLGHQWSKKVKNSQETVKTAKMTIGVPIATCLLRVRRIHKVRVRIHVRVRRIHKAEANEANRAVFCHNIAPKNWQIRNF